jgi:hypothetical protein
MKKLWTDRAWNEYILWQEQDKKTLRKLNKLINEIERSPYNGIGKPNSKKAYSRIKTEPPTTKTPCRTNRCGVFSFPARVRSLVLLPSFPLLRRCTRRRSRRRAVAKMGSGSDPFYARRSRFSGVSKGGRTPLWHTLCDSKV